MKAYFSPNRNRLRGGTKTLKPRYEKSSLTHGLISAWASSLAGCRSDALRDAMGNAIGIHMLFYSIVLSMIIIYSIILFGFEAVPRVV